MTWRDSFFRNIQMSDEYMGRWTPPVIRVIPKGDTAAHLSEPNRCAGVKNGSKNPWVAGQRRERSFRCYWKEYKVVQPPWKTVLKLLITLNRWLLCCCCWWDTKSCQTLCDLVHCNTPGFPALHHLPGLAQTHVHWVSNAIQSTHPLPPSSFVLNLSSIRIFSNESTLCISGQSIGSSASASVFPMNIQDWLPLG